MKTKLLTKLRKKAKNEYIVRQELKDGNVFYCIHEKYEECGGIVFYSRTTMRYYSLKKAKTKCDSLRNDYILQYVYNHKDRVY